MEIPGPTDHDDELEDTIGPPPGGGAEPIRRSVRIVSVAVGALVLALAASSPFLLPAPGAPGPRWFGLFLAWFAAPFLLAGFARRARNGTERSRARIFSGHLRGLAVALLLPALSASAVTYAVAHLRPGFSLGADPVGRAAGYLMGGLWMVGLVLGGVAHYYDLKARR